MARGLAQAGGAVVGRGRNAAKNERGGRGAAGAGREGRVRRRRRHRQGASCRWSWPRAVRFGRLDILVNNAGINIRKQPAGLRARGMEHACMDTNLTSAFLCVQAAYPGDDGGGRRQDHQHRLDAVDLRRRLRRALCREQGRHRAADQGAARSPGPRTTSRSTRCCRAGSTPISRATRAARWPGLNERVLGRTPAGRWGDPKDFAGIAVFLAFQSVGLR